MEEPEIFHINTAVVKRRKTEDGPHIKVHAEEDVKNSPFLMASVLDCDVYPNTDDKDTLEWEHFTVPFASLDREYTDSFGDLCDKHIEELVDLRPYMIENPEQCTKFDFLPKLVARFRHLHLRHLVVTNSFTGEPEGMITRGDLFSYMPL